MRADLLLVARGLVESRSRAQAEIAAGHVTSGGRVIARPSEMLDEAADLVLSAEALVYVSRGALKLIHALDHFGLSPAGRVALDLGASTGGFTEVLLERGAACVYAVDVGHGQLHPKLRADPRVVCLEGTDARALGLALIPAKPGFITADLSFIGLEKALPAALALAVPEAFLIALLKPQFEAGPGAVGKGGVLRNAGLRDAAVARVTGWLSAQPGWHDLGIVESPIKGGDGNVEFLIAARRES
jgi:23S rRNA (cytidine1920-2'-O)/16S rRNA (cytidine1409-2'-O)-methyltransferase